MPKPLPNDTWDHLFYPPLDYSYFENSAGFDFEPNATAFSWKNAWWLADAALLAYVKDWSAVEATLTKARFDAVKQIGPADTTSTKGFFAARSGPQPFGIVAFRGTDRDDRRNMRTDELIGPVVQDGYTLHRGFVEALAQVWGLEVAPMLADFMQTHPGACIYFTGHSLGAALATLAALKFAGTNCALYTYGSPRVGDDAFVQAVIQKTKQRVFRFVNSQDIVTQIPTEIPFMHYFRHAGWEKYIDRDGRIHEHPSELDKASDVTRGIFTHDGESALKMIGHPLDFCKNVMRTEPLVDPPPYVLGNHTPARYAIRIWNFYSGQ